MSWGDNRIASNVCATTTRDATHARCCRSVTRRADCASKSTKSTTVAADTGAVTTNAVAYAAVSASTTASTTATATHLG